MSQPYLIALLTDTPPHNRVKALYNATERQHGNSLYLLTLESDASLSKDSLGLVQTTSSPPPSSVVLPSVSLSQADILATNKFLRTFALTNLLPWMERLVLDWSDTVTFQNSVELSLSLIRPIVCTVTTTSIETVYFHKKAVCDINSSIPLPLP